MARGRHGRPVGKPRRALWALMAIGVVAGAAGVGSYAAFSSTTSSSGNSFSAGTVTITDDDGGATMLTLSNAKPGDTASGCIKVSYSGSLTANVHLYGTVTGTLGQYLTLTVTRGTGATFGSCGTFTADSTNYFSNGAGVLYSGALSSYPATYAAGIVDPNNCGSPPCAAQSWTNGTNKVYKFAISVNNDNNAQGLSSSATFTWEAQNT